VLRVLTVLAILLAPAAVAAQSTSPVSPTGPAHPSYPWWGYGPSTPTGQLLRDVWVPPQPVVVDTIVPWPSEATGERATPPAPEGEPAQYGVWRQTVVIPGYWLRETTAGTYYPERWTLEQTAPGMYRWRLLPSEVRPR